MRRSNKAADGRVTFRCSPQSLDDAADVVCVATSLTFSSSDILEVWILLAGMFGGTAGSILGSNPNMGSLVHLWILIVYFKCEMDVC